jgi:uncharacterized protein (UPF0335 family)
MTKYSFERAKDLMPEIEKLEKEVKLLADNKQSFFACFRISGHDFDLTDLEGEFYRQVLGNREHKLAELQAEFQSL